MPINNSQPPENIALSASSHGAPVAAWTGHNKVIFKHKNMVVTTKYIAEYISLIKLALESPSKLRSIYFQHANHYPHTRRGNNPCTGIVQLIGKVLALDGIEARFAPLIRLCTIRVGNNF
jgi:hypothetical protein